MSEARATWRVRFPRDGDFSKAQATAFITSLVPLFASASVPVVLEWRSDKKLLSLLLSAPLSWEASLRAQLAAWFPGCRLERVADAEEVLVTALPFRLAKPDHLPIGEAEENPDPILAVFGALSESDTPWGVHLLLSPPPSSWKRWKRAAKAALASGYPAPPHGWLLYPYQLFRLLKDIFAPSYTDHPANPVSKELLIRVMGKLEGPVFTASLIVWTEEANPSAYPTLSTIAQYLSGVGSAGPNQLVSAATPYQLSLSDPALKLPRYLLSAREVAQLFHLPSGDYPFIPRDRSRQVPPPTDLLLPHGSEKSVLQLGEALSVEGPLPFGISVAERRHHAYIVGKTGTGKSTLLAQIARQDIEAGRGFALLDPHGDLARHVLSLVPPERFHDVIYFDPADREFPIGFNPLLMSSPKDRLLLGSHLISVLKKLNQEFWGPRLEHILRNALLALTDTPTPSLLSVHKLLTDREYRQEQILPFVRDPVVRAFFTFEFERLDPRFRAEAISPILNKIGSFISSPLVRNIIGQPRGINLRELMDSGRILIANLSSGSIGEDTSALFGSLLVAGFQLAATSRADLPEEQRSDFSLLVDEFHSFASDSFASILSEARKYCLSLFLSNQYLDQLPPQILQAVLGNVGTLVAFRVGHPDALRLTKELSPVFDLEDLLNLPDFHFCVRQKRESEVLPAFSARTVPSPQPASNTQPLIDLSREQWASNRASVEMEIADGWEGRL
jgi:hypothetical protein